MVAAIAPEPVTTSVAVSDYRARNALADVSAQAPLIESPLPPVPEPVPAPVPAPLPSPSQAFAAALASEALAPASSDSLSALRKLTDRWSPPPSSLALTDRLV